MRRQGYLLRERKRHERGGVLVVSILVIVVMLLLAIPFLFKLSAGYRSTERGARALAAFNLAEAGVDKVLWRLNDEFLPPFTDLDPDPEKIIPFEFWIRDGTTKEGMIIGMRTSDANLMGDVTVRLAPPLGTEPDTRFLEATGIIPFIVDNTVERTVRVTLQKFFRPIWDFAFVVDDHFYTQNNLLMDSYNSSDGPYGGDNIGNLGWLFADNYEPGSVIFDQSQSWEIFGVLASAPETTDINATIEFPKQIDFDPENKTVFYEHTEDGTVIPLGDERTLMQDHFEFPPVDISDLPPKEKFGEDFPSLTNWFEDSYTAANVGEMDQNGDGMVNIYDEERISRAPLASDIIDAYEKGSKTLDKGGVVDFYPQDSGVYQSLVFEGGATLNINGEVVLYVTGYQGTGPGQFYINRGDINLVGEDSRLVLILGDTTFKLEQSTNINAPANIPGIPSDCIILGTEQFRTPPDWENPNLHTSIEEVGVMNLENNGIISAAIYAPGAAIRGSQGNTNLDIFGAAVSYSMDFKVNLNLHYDEALGMLEFIKGGIPFWKIVNWHEKVGQ